MLLRVTGAGLLLAMIWAGCALASPYDDMTVAQIRAHPEFVEDDYSLSSATNSGDPDAPRIYWWIGYIPSSDKRVYFTSFGEPLTCVKWEVTGEWVPEWVVDALDRLHEEGYIEL